MVLTFSFNIIAGVFRYYYNRLWLNRQSRDMAFYNNEINTKTVLKIL